MNFGELKDQVRSEAWADAEQENLVAVHNAFFPEALYDLQKAIPCLQQGNTDVYPACATYFNCGFTVLPKPAGHIIRVYVIDRINPETGEEDPTAQADWCQRIYLSQVEWCHMIGYQRLCERCSGSTVASVADALASSFFGIYRYKRAYPRPTDVGLESLPLLPEGYHYPQASTDAGGRSPSGVFSLYRGRIWIAPWIEQTESVVVEWNGIKRKWNDADIVEDDPEFKRAVRLHVSMQHELAYGDNPTKLAQIKETLYGSNAEVGVIPWLIHECNEQTRIHRCNEAGVSAGAARGMGASTNQFYNDQRKEYIARCPTGQTGTAITSVAEVGSVGSPLSVADANLRAGQQVIEDANNRLVCVAVVPVFYSIEKRATAYCAPAGVNAAGDPIPAAEGAPSAAIIPAGQYSAATQLAADALAEAAATAAANDGLSCTFWNARQESTEECTGVGTDVTKEIAAHTSPFFSTVSQAIADALAKAEATKQALAELLTTCDNAVAFYNTARSQSAIAQGNRTTSGPLGVTTCIVRVTVTVTVSPGRFANSVSIAAANSEADAFALVYANQAAQQLFLTRPCGIHTQTINL